MNFKQHNFFYISSVHINKIKIVIYLSWGENAVFELKLYIYIIHFVCR